MLPLKLLQQLVRTLNSDGTPGQVAAGIALGAAFGLTPLPAGFALDPLFDAIGTKSRPGGGRAAAARRGAAAAGAAAARDAGPRRAPAAGRDPAAKAVKRVRRLSDSPWPSRGFSRMGTMRRRDVVASKARRRVAVASTGLKPRLGKGCR